MPRLFEDYSIIAYAFYTFVPMHFMISENGHISCRNVTLVCIFYNTIDFILTRFQRTQMLFVQTQPLTQFQLCPT